MIYPEVRAGQRVTAELLRSMMADVIVKPSSTDRTNTTTAALDPDLYFTGEAGATYFVEMILMPAATLAADFRTAWEVPSDTAGFRNVLGPGSSANSSSADNIAMRAGVHNYGTNVIYSGVRDAGSVAYAVQEWSVMTLTVGGTVGLMWAQGTSTGDFARLAVGSFMRVRRLA